LIQLQLKTKEDVKSIIEKHMVDTAKKNVVVGANLLYECALGNEECHCGDDRSRVDVALTKAIVTPENIRNYPEIADKYVMRIPVDSFECIRYEDMMFELGQRLKYVRYHHEELSVEEKMRVLKFEEIRECCKLGLVNGGVLVEECIEMLKIKDEETGKALKDAKEQAELEKSKAVKEAEAKAAMDKAKAVQEAKEQAELEKSKAVKEAEAKAAMDKEKAVQETKEQPAVDKREVEAERDKARKEKEKLSKELILLKEQIEKWKPLIDEEERRRKREEEIKKKEEEERRRREEETKKKGEELLRQRPELRRERIEWIEKGAGTIFEMLCELLKRNAIPTRSLFMDGDLECERMN